MKNLKHRLLTIRPKKNLLRVQRRQNRCIQPARKMKVHITHGQNHSHTNTATELIKPEQIGQGLVQMIMLMLMVIQNIRIIKADYQNLFHFIELLGNCIHRLIC